MRLLLLALLFSLAGCDWEWSREDECDRECGEDYSECVIDPETRDVIACRYVRE